MTIGDERTHHTGGVDSNRLSAWDDERVIAEVSKFALFASSSPIGQVEFQDDALNVRLKSGERRFGIRGRDIKTVVTRSQLLHSKLTVTTHAGEEYSIGGLNRKQAETLNAALLQSIKKHRNSSQSRADQLSRAIIQAEREATVILSPVNYLRRSTTSEAIQKAVSSAAANHGFAEEFLSPQARNALEHVRKLNEPEGLEPERQEANRLFVANEIARVKAATQDISKQVLTDEQARAAATDEHVTLVLAGAGTGKTAVITAKIAHLVRNQGIPPENILVLAFNRDAAQEIRDRLPEDLRAANVSTFHAFGLQVIASRSKAPTISTMASDPYALAKAIESILGELINDPDLGNVAIRLMANMPADYKAPFDFKNEGEYRRYIREVELRALSGDRVKSFEELGIANWLTQNGIAFRYERTYPEDTANKERRQYQPDFWLPGYDIYIEHFALNESGRAPEGWTDYEEGVQWKRNKHRENGTALIETYSWQHREDTLLPILRQKLGEAGVEFDPISREQLIARLGRERISPLCSLLCAFLNHAKSSNLPHQELERRAQDASDRKRADAFLEVFRKIREDYETRMAEEKAIDFHDLINQATESMASGEAENRYTHVLVDEFQDISAGRMELLKVLQKPELAYFLVGDDWQSIYRFAGSRVSLVRHVSEHLGHTRTETLTQTFRFGRKILEPSSRFIQQNPEQTRRTLQPNLSVNDKGITVVASREPADGLRAVIKDLAESDDYEEKDTIMVLGRFRGSRAALRLQGPKTRDKVTFRTVHTAKGQEADYVVILDLKDSKYGFPCRVEDDPILKLVLPPLEDGEYQFAEERRLFYVGLTRAKKGVYLVTDERRPSPFVRELLKAYGKEIRQISKLMPPCPRCPDGSLIESRSHENLRCSNHPECRYLSPICPGCKVGFVSIGEQGTTECSNPDCYATQTICPRCRQGILVKRLRRKDGRPFFGCSRFAEEFACRYMAR